MRQEIIDALKQMLWKMAPIDLTVKYELIDERKRARGTDELHLRETADWLCRAQDRTPDDGVSRSYKAARHQGYGPYGWQASYPETTGYIIPTMLALTYFFKDAAFEKRALRMADWELAIQLESGAVMGSVVTAPPKPAVFNTGQVIFGWISAFQQTQNQKYIAAAGRAGDFLLSVQEENGSWIKANSPYALRNATVYNTRVAWALIELGLETDQKKYIQAGKKNIEFALSRQEENGWFSDNCLDDPSNPLLHTVVYATRGILESGIALREERYLKAAQKTLAALMQIQRKDGGLAGRLDKDWRQAVHWDCVTGDAQAAVAWLRLHAQNGEENYRVAARRAVDFVKRTQNIQSRHNGIRGGVKGSFPFNGEYGQYEMLNWAAKFFCDALMMIADPELAAKGIKG